jgi:hypothetical protein
MPEKDWRDVVNYLKKAGIGAIFVIILNIVITWNVHSYRINKIEESICVNDKEHSEMKTEYQATREQLIDFMPTINMRLHYIEKDVKDIKTKIYNGK